MKIGPLIGVGLHVGLHGPRQIGEQRFEVLIEAGLEGLIHTLIKLLRCQPTCSEVITKSCDRAVSLRIADSHGNPMGGPRLHRPVRHRPHPQGVARGKTYSAWVVTSHEPLSGAESSSARMEYSFRRNSTRASRPFACCSGVPVATICHTAPATWPISGLNPPSSSPPSLMDSHGADTSSACSVTYARPSSVNVYTRRPASVSTRTRPSSSSCCSVGYIEPGLGFQPPPLRVAIS